MPCRAQSRCRLRCTRRQHPQTPPFLLLLHRRRRLLLLRRRRRLLLVLVPTPAEHLSHFLAWSRNAHRPQPVVDPLVIKLPSPVSNRCTLRPRPPVPSAIPSPSPPLSDIVLMVSDTESRLICWTLLMFDSLFPGLVYRMVKPNVYQGRVDRCQGEQPFFC